jgi:hypothetical protein
MSATHHFTANLCAENVDVVNGVIRGVSVITAGVIARGHDLAVDDTTLVQMHSCALSRGQVPVKIDHKSGAASVCGFLTNFRRDGDKLKADWHLLESHPQRAQILETVQRMPRGVGLSAAFVSPERSEAGKARVAELISVDYVTLPAANPDGMFARKDEPRRVTGLEKVRRVLGGAAHGAEIGSLAGLTGGAVLRTMRPGLKFPADTSSAAGATIGALAGGVYQARRIAQRQPERDLAARVSQICFDRREATFRRLKDAVANNVSVPIPGEDQAELVTGVAKKPFVRRAGVRLLKIGGGAGLGYLVGRKAGAKAGAITGAVAGALFQNPDVRGTVRLAVMHARKIHTL